MKEIESCEINNQEDIKDKTKFFFLAKSELQFADTQSKQIKKKSYFVTKFEIKEKKKTHLKNEQN